MLPFFGGLCLYWSVKPVPILNSTLSFGSNTNILPIMFQHLPVPVSCFKTLASESWKTLTLRSLSDLLPSYWHFGSFIIMPSPFKASTFFSSSSKWAWFLHFSCLWSYTIFLFLFFKTSSMVSSLLKNLVVSSGASKTMKVMSLQEPVLWDELS